MQQKIYIEEIPIIDGNSVTNFKFFKDQIIALVEHILSLHKRNPQTPHEQELLQREIDATDAQIERLVYDLYGLTEEEIRIVEGETS